MPIVIESEIKLWQGNDNICKNQQNTKFDLFDIISPLINETLKFLFES